jgi:regulatory protein
MNKAYSLLAIRPRSENELRVKLVEKFDPKVVDNCIDKLKNYKYINDADFANKWVTERSKSRGRRALKYKLIKKGIESNTIEDALSIINGEYEFDNALKLIKDKKRFQSITKDEAYKKIGSFLSGRGYSYDTIKKIIEKIYK